MENKRNRTAATKATKAQPSKQRVVKRTQKIETFCFNLDDIQRIEVKAIPAEVPKPPPQPSPFPPPPPRLHVCIVAVVRKPPW
jgi:hypothetical protein